MKRPTIQDWYEAGVARGATHLLLVRDTFEDDNQENLYPVFGFGDADTMRLHAKYDDPNMQIVIEVFDLRADKDEQLDSPKRVMRLPPETPRRRIFADEYD